MKPSEALLLATCPENQGVKAVISVTVMFFLATIVVAIRFYVRLVMLHGATGWDDYFILGSLVSATITFALYVKLFMAGMGRHIYCLRSEQILDLQKWALLSQIGVSITLGLMKISVCLFVLRVVDKARKGIAKALWLLIYFVALTHILQVIMYVIQCRPLAALWNRKVKGQCFSTHIVYMVAYLNYGTECFTDFVCIGIIIYITQSLKMKTKTKIAICGLMAFGYFTAACHIIAAVTLRGVFESDYSWGIVKPAMWVGHSAFVGITAASLPSLRPIFKLMSGEKVSEFFSQLLLQSKSRSSSDSDHPGSSNKAGSSKSRSPLRLHFDNKEGNKKKSFYCRRPEDGCGKNDDAVIKMNNRTTAEMSQQAVPVPVPVVTLPNQHQQQHQQKAPPSPDTGSQLSLLLSQKNNSVPRDKRRYSSHSSIRSTGQDLESGPALPLDKYE